jgi:hypothetical protein
VGGVVVVLVVLIAIKVAPVTIAVGEFDKEIGVLADRANRREYHDQRILQSILDKAERLDLPVTKKQVDIDRTSTRIKITVVYDVPIEFPGYTYIWHKEHFHERPIFHT